MYLLLALCCAASALATYPVGDEPPDFTLTDTAGNAWSLAGQRGKVVMINFGQTASQPCDSSFAHIQPDFVDGYDPAVFTAVHIDVANQTAQQLVAYWGFFNPQFPILTMGGTLFGDWGEEYIPHTVVLDPIGIVRGNWIGFYQPFYPRMHETILAHINPTGLYVQGHTVTVTAGDADQVFEPGEVAGLTVTLENMGLNAATNVSATLDSPSEWVTISPGVIGWPNMSPGQTGLGTAPFTLTLSESAPEAMDLPLELSVSCDQGEAVLRFSIEVGQRVAYWTMNGEEGSEGWTHAATAGWNDVWHLSTEFSHSPTHAWKAGSATTGTYGNHVDCRLVSPPLALENWSRLHFWHRMDAEVSAAFPDSAYDGGVVEISLDDGANWTQLFPMTGYNKAFRGQSGGGNPASHNFPGQTPCYSGNFPWEEAVFDLAAFNGETMRLGFHFGSDNGGSQEGWYVDDLVLAAPTEDTGLAPLARPRSLALLEAWPNPFNPTTRIAYEVGEAGLVRLALFDLAGRQVGVLAEGVRAAGRHELSLDAASLAGGIYLLSLESAHGTRSLKLLLVR
jgi:uncharacterized repeat protein (TIGR01451 family)